MNFFLSSFLPFLLSFRLSFFLSTKSQRLFWLLLTVKRDWLRESIIEIHPGGGEIFRTCPDRPWSTPSLLYNGYRVFPGGKVRPGRAADHSPPSSAEVMKE
jgi:hypothetical protein